MIVTQDFIDGLRAARDIAEKTAQEYDDQGGVKYAVAVREAVAAIDAQIFKLLQEATASDVDVK